MMQTTTRITEPASQTSKAKSGTTAYRIRFIPSLETGREAMCSFIDPKIMFAIVDTSDESALLGVPSWPEPFDQLDVRIASGSSAAVHANWLIAPDHSDAPLPISVPVGRGQLSWRPGRALVESADLNDDAMVAIAEFAFYEGELRRLEETLRPFEASAAADAHYAFQMGKAATDLRMRFGQTIESLAVLRLTFARLEPRLLTPSRRLPVASRRLIRQLSRRAAIEDRLSAFNDRLEVCEDLYEGAVDRLTDHRWYRKGNLLEIIIVVLLLIEVVQLSADMALRWMRDHAH